MEAIVSKESASCALFVYGTLAPGRPNEHILKPYSGTWSKAYVFGTLHNEGWGAELGYPGITLDGNAAVDGFVFESQELGKLWPKLDEFEGDAYSRKEVKAFLESGEQVSAYIYTVG